VIPVVWSILKEWEMRRGKLRYKGVGH